MTRKSNRSWLTSVGKILCTTVLAIGLIPSAAQDNETNPYEGDALAAKEGYDLFTHSGCVPCHGPDAEGAIGPSLIDDKWIFAPTPGMIYRTIRGGRRGTRMIGFAERLREDETWKIVEFILSKGRAQAKAEHK